jgi:hypothetical protein
VLPHRFQQLLAAEHPPRCAGQLQQQPQLGGRERHAGAVLRHDEPHPVERQLAVPLHGRVGLRLGGGPPQHGPDPGLQDAGLHGLDHVVVGPGFQARHDVDVVVARGEHDDRQVAHRADPPAHLEPVDPRQHQVEHDHLRRRQPLQPLLAGLHGVHDVTLPGQRQLEPVAHRAVVLDQQHP